MNMLKSLVLFLLLLSGAPVIAQPTVNNSNYWPVYRDDTAGFRISYPADWIVVKPKGRNVRFSVNPPDGPGNCNVVALQKAEIRDYSQLELNQEISSLAQDRASWASYIGIPVSQVRVIESQLAAIGDIPALLGTIESTLENLEGKYTRKQVVVMTFTPGMLWSLNCGASSFNVNETRSRFTKLKPRFNKVLGSFVFLP